MFSSGTTESPQSGITPLGINESTTSTAAQARPLPVFWGTQKLGVTFVSRAFNQHHQAVSQDSGKSDVVIGYNYDCQFAALICHGPVDAIHEIRYNDKVIWKPSSPLTRGSENYVRIDVETQYGTEWRLYWGTETQEIDCPAECEPRACTTVPAMGTFGSAAHGFNEGDAVRISAATMPTGLTVRIVYYAVNVTLDAFQLATTADGSPVSFTTSGSEVSVRKLHAKEHATPFYLSDLAETWWAEDPEYHPAYRGQCYIVGRKHCLGYNTTTIPQIEIVVSRWPDITGKVGTSGKEDYMVPKVIEESVTNARYGLGLSSAIDSTTFASANLQLGTERFGISPFLDRAQSFADFVLDMMGYIDGFYYSNALGKLCVGMNRGVACSAAAASPVWIDETCLADVPKLSASSINTTLNIVQVQCTDQDVGYKSNCCTAHSSGSMKMLGSTVSEALDRPWVTRMDLADKMARAAVKIKSLPGLKGTLTVRKSRLHGLMVGSPFYFSYALYSLCHLHCVVTAVRVSDPFSPVVELDFQRDYGYLNGEAYDAAYTAPVTTTVTAPKITDAVLIEFPACDFEPSTGQPCFVVMASRPNTQAGKQVGGIVVKYLADQETQTYVTASTLASARSYQARLKLNGDLDTSETGVNVSVLSKWDTLPDSASWAPPGDGSLDYLVIWTSTDNSVQEIMALDGFSPGENDGDGNPTFALTVRRGVMDVPGQIIAAATPGLTGWVVRLNTIKYSKFTIPLDLAINEAATVVVYSLINTSASPVSDPFTCSFVDRTYRPWKPRAAILSWPSTWSDSTLTLTFHWTARFKKEAKAGDAGPAWYLDIRPTSDSFDLQNPEVGQVFAPYWAADETEETDKTYITVAVKAEDIEEALVGRVTFTARLFAVQNNLSSLFCDSKEIIKV